MGDAVRDLRLDGPRSSILGKVWTLMGRSNAHGPLDRGSHAGGPLRSTCVHSAAHDAPKSVAHVQPLHVERPC